MKKLVLAVAIVLLGTGISFSQQKIGINIGNKAPELIGTSPDGNR